VAPARAIGALWLKLARRESHPDPIVTIHGSNDGLRTATLTVPLIAKILQLTNLRFSNSTLKLTPLRLKPGFGARHTIEPA
jgi:hypothetical protein